MLAAVPQLPAIPLALTAAILSTAIPLQVFQPKLSASLISEGGAIESVSALLWAVALLVAVIALLRKRTAGRLAGVVMLSWAVLRELDFQKAFTYRSVESLGYYTRDIAPWSEKLLVMAALLPFAVAGAYLARLVWKDLRKGKLAGSAYGGHLLLAVGVIALSGACEKLLDFTVVEEVAEMALALVMLFLTINVSNLLAPKPAPAPVETSYPREEEAEPWLVGQLTHREESQRAEGLASRH